MRSQRARGARGHRASSRQSDEAPRRRAGPTVGGPQPATRPRYDFALMINLILSLRRTNASGGRAGRALHHGIDVDPRQPGERRQAHRDRVREGDETLAQAMAPRGAGVDEALAGHGDVDERERLGSWALDDPQSGVGRRGESLRRRGCAGVAAGSRLGSRERPRDPFVLVDGASDLRRMHDVCTAHGSPT